MSAIKQLASALSERRRDCSATDSLLRRLEADNDEVEKLGGIAPMFFVNGSLVKPPVAISVVDSMIASVLRQRDQQ